MRQRRLATLAVLACMGGGIAHAQVAEEHLEWGVTVGVEHSDNVHRTQVDEQSETVGTAGIFFAIILDRPRLDASLNGDLVYRDYFDDSYESEVVGGVAATINYAISPERFYWLISDNFGQIAEDRTRVDTPDNRQNFNYFTTGPDIIFPLGARTSAQLSGRFSDTYYEERIEDYQSLTGSLALIRQMSETSSVSLNVSNTSVEYDEEELFQEYEITQGFVRYARDSTRTTLSLDVGYSEVSVGDQSSDGLLARFSLDRAIGAYSHLGIEAGTEFLTSGDVFRRDQTLTGIESGAEDVIASTDPFQADYAYVTWTTDRLRTGIRLTLSARREEHETTSSEDREIYAAALTITRQISQRFSGEFTAGYREEEFTNQGFKFDEQFAGLGLNWRLTQNVEIRFRVDHFEGSSENGTRDFDENRVYLGIAYRRTGT
jgi:hypothetical protein